jgi:hypothetical protein
MIKGSISQEMSTLFNTYRTSLLSGFPSDQLSKQITNDSKECLTDIQNQLAINKALQDLHYTQLGQNRESAMDWDEISRTLYLFQKLKRHYGATFIAKKGTDGILGDLVTSLAKSCGDLSIATDPSKRQYNPLDSNKIRSRKTALRALLDDAPNTKFGSCLHPGAPEVYGNGKLFSARELLAYFILAASDPNMPLPHQLEADRELCIKEEMLNVVENLNDVRRGHNNDGDLRGKEDPIDEPTCFPGLIGRIGNMHLHNQITALEEFNTPSDHFKRKMQAFIIAQFAGQPPEVEFNIVNAIFYRMNNSEKDPNNHADDIFVSQLLTTEQLEAFINDLSTEFGELDNAHLKMAILTYINELLHFKERIEQTLLTRLEEIANENIVHAVRKSIEATLEKEGITNNTVNRLGDIMKEIAILAEDLRLLSNTQIASLQNIAQLQSIWQNLKTKHDNLIHQQMLLSQSILKEVDKRLIVALGDYERIYQINRGKETKILSANNNKDQFYPFWFSKAKLHFEDLDIQCQSAALDFSEIQNSTRQQILLEQCVARLHHSDFLNINKLKVTKRDLAIQIERHIAALNSDDTSNETLFGLKAAKHDFMMAVEEFILLFKRDLNNWQLTNDDKHFLINALLSNQALLVDAGMDEKTAALFAKIHRSLKEVDAYVEQYECQEPVPSSKRTHLPSLKRHKSSASAPLSPFEIQKAQHYLMAHADNPGMLKLTSYLKPGILVKIDPTPSDPVKVNFVDPFGTLNRSIHLPLSLLKEYAEYDKKLRKSLAHEVDVVLRGFCELNEINYEDRPGFQELFLKQLCWHKENNPEFFKAVLTRQSSKDLTGLLDRLSLFPKDHPYQTLGEALIAARQRWSQEYLKTHLEQPQESWEQLQTSLAQCALESDVQKVYRLEK